MRPLVVVGAGGFGREVVQIVAAVNAVAPTWELVGFLDDGPAAVTPAGTVPVLGPVAALADLPNHAAVLAVGSPPGRAAIARAHPRQEWATLVHPDTTVAPGTRLGAGCVVAPGARVSVGCSLGDHVHVDQNVTIGHDCSVGAFARFNPQACISGSTTVGSEVLVGANATILQGLALGDGCVVGAGAVVVRDAGRGTTVKGVPAR